MRREYWVILIVYIGMQFSSLVGIPVFIFGFDLLGINRRLAVPVWLLVSFSIALVIVLLILRKEIRAGYFNERGSSIGYSIKWSVIGFFLALSSQYAAAIVENLLGIKSGSQNTQEIIDIINSFPLAILVTSVFGPILEEIVFRKIIFGAIYKRFNFFLSALMSSVIFALAHREPEHILLYSAMGLTFAYLYVKTKRILVPIIAHVTMNTMVVLVQSVYREDIERLLREAQAVQNFIGGFL